MLGERSERSTGSEPALQALGRRTAQLAFDEHAVVVGRIDLREANAELDPARTKQLSQALDARYHVVALVTADQRRGHPAAAPELRLRDPGAPARLDQEIAADHAPSL